MSEPIIPRYEPPPSRPRRSGSPSAPKRRQRDPRLPWWRARLSWRFGVRQIYFLCLQLKSYIEAGFPIIEAWHLMSISTDHPRIRRMCRAVHSDLREGKPLREALKRHEGPLPRYFINLMAAAERSGSFGSVLSTLQKHYAWLFEIKSEIIRALTYLLINLFLAKFVFLIRDFILVGIAQSADGHTLAWPENPALTLLSMTWISFRPMIIAILLAYLITTAMCEYRRLKWPTDLLGLSVPGIGRVIRNYCAGNLCRMYWTQTTSGMHPSNVYTDSVASMGNLVLERRLMQWRRFVDDGEPIHEALRRAGVLPAHVLAVFETDDHASSAGDALLNVADLLSEETRHMMRGIIRGMTPFVPFVIAFAFFGGISTVLCVPFIDFLIFLCFFLIFLI